MNQEQHCFFSFFKDCRWVCESSGLLVVWTCTADSNKLSAVSDFNDRIFNLSWHSERVCHVLWQQFKVLLLWLWEWKVLLNPDPLFCTLLQHNWTDQSVSWIHGLQSSWHSAKNLGRWFHHYHSALQTGNVRSITASWCMNKLLTSKTAQWIANTRFHSVTNLKYSWGCTISQGPHFQRNRCWPLC